MGLFDKLIKISENKYATKVSEANEADITSFIDTGSYTLNALFSGSIYGGIPSNKVSALAGDPATGKTFFALQMAKQFLLDNPKGAVFYFESEQAVTTDLLDSRNIDKERFYILPVSTIQEFRTQAVKILETYMEEDESKRQPILFILDSLGMLSTTKEIEDMVAGKDTRDMTKAQLVKGTFRVLTLKLGRAKVALLVVNHVYNVIGSYVPLKTMGGGTGLEYAGSSIVFLAKSKSKDKSTNEITGAIITATNKKSRITIEHKSVEILLDHRRGLDRYYGLLEIADKYEIVKKVGNKYEFPGGKTAFEKNIINDPEKYFTKDVLDLIDEACKKEFKYNSDVEEPKEDLKDE